MMTTEASSAQTMVEMSPVETSTVRAAADSSLLESRWGGRVVASSFVVLAVGLYWVCAATAMIG